MKRIILAAFAATALAILGAVPAMAQTSHTGAPGLCTPGITYTEIVGPRGVPLGEGAWWTNNCANQQLRTNVESTDDVDTYSGWVEALNLETSVNAGGSGTMRTAWLQTEPDGGGARSCLRVYPTVGTWFGC